MKYSRMANSRTNTMANKMAYKMAKLTVFYYYFEMLNYSKYNYIQLNGLQIGLQIGQQIGQVNYILYIM